MFMGFYSRRYIRGVADFVAAGRVCGRYVISVGNIALALAVFLLIANVEVNYKTGFALTFWQNLLPPVLLFLALTGYCLYRFRETKSMSIGQFLEMRYNRSLRVFASGLRSVAEIMANMIMPAVTARFFIYFLGLPHHVKLFGWQFPTFMIVVFISLALCISLILMGGQLALIITDTIQGMMCFPLCIIFIWFLLTKFSWGQQILPVLTDRVPGESFLCPYDIAKLRDFNLFYLLVTIFSLFMHTASGYTGNTGSGRSPQEQKMAGVLGTWRTAFSFVFYIVFSIGIIVFMCHRDFSSQAKTVRTEISRQAVDELVPDPAMKKRITDDLRAIPANDHRIGKDAPFSQAKNPDTPYFDTVYRHLKNQDDGAMKTQEFKTIFHQVMLPVTMRHLLPNGLLGLFILMMVLFMISSDDSRINSAAMTVAQDCVVPFCKRLTPEKHLKIIRIVVLVIGMMFLFGSYFMAQLDYINLFIAIMYSMWTGGCGPVIILGLYSRFGTTAGAFTSLISGMALSLLGIFCQRNWADMIYPWLDEMNWVTPVGNFFTALSKPFHPYIVWEMNPLKFPINSYELYFLTMIITLILYCAVSYLTLKEPFNLERMLHRGVYSLNGERKIQSAWTFRNFFPKLIGITPEYTKGDRVISWSVFIYVIIYQFGIAFVGVVIWNFFSPWPLAWWGNYFLTVSLIIPGIAALVSTFWFGIGGVLDLKRMFRDLKNRAENDLDNGQVEGHMSLADKAQLEAVDAKAKE
jgi:Na+/proline symporter